MKFWIIVGLAVISSPLFAASAADRQAVEPPVTSATLETSSVVPLFVFGDRGIAMLTIGDNPPSPVAFDTGTDENILDKTYVARLHLAAAGTGTMIDAASGRSTSVPLAAVRDAKLSGVPIQSGTVQVLDYGDANEIGVFGPNSFSDHFVIIEAGLNRIRLVPKNTGYTTYGPGVAYADGLPTIPITIDGRRIMAHLDTGNDQPLVVGEDLQDKIRLVTPMRTVGIAQSALGSKEVKGGELAGSLGVGPLEIAQPAVSFLGQGANVGFPIARKLTIVLDPERKLSWVLDPHFMRPSLKDYVGIFGDRTIRVEGDGLVQQRTGRPAYHLDYAGGDLFDVPATHDRIQFFRKHGRVERLELITFKGQVASADRAE